VPRPFLLACVVLVLVSVCGVFFYILFTALPDASLWVGWSSPASPLAICSAAVCGENFSSVHNGTNRNYLHALPHRVPP
jgi:hypothetical protein